MAEWPLGRALIVGGSGGLGEAISRALHQAGAKIAIGYRSGKARAEALAQSLGDGAIAVHLDLDDESSIKDALEACGAIHSLVHAAGAKIDQPYLSATDPKEYAEVLRADAEGFFTLIHHALPLLRESRGSIVLISSAGLERHPPGDLLSVAPKAANEAVIRAIAREEGRYGVRANSVRVGIVDAGMFPELVERGELTETYLEAAKRNIALRRFGEAEEVARAVVFLASSDASYITGQALHLDGGYSI